MGRNSGKHISSVPVVYLVLLLSRRKVGVPSRQCLRRRVGERGLGWLLKDLNTGLEKDNRQKYRAAGAGGTQDLPMVGGYLSPTPGEAQQCTGLLYHGGMQGLILSLIANPYFYRTIFEVPTADADQFPVFPKLFPVLVIPIGKSAVKFETADLPCKNLTPHAPLAPSRSSTYTLIRS